MSNNQLPAWRYEEHFHRVPMSEDFDGHYEVTNGNISLCTSDDPEDITETENTLHRVASALNESGCKFYCNTATEHALHIENMLLRAALEEIAMQRTCAEMEADEEIPIGSDGTRLGDINMGYDCCIETARGVLKQIKYGAK